jgi:hypothetical protein
MREPMNNWKLCGTKGLGSDGHSWETVIQNFFMLQPLRGGGETSLSNYSGKMALGQIMNNRLDHC